MKTLQNNFTTPEQSKQLLELGVPADSADLYYQDYGSIPMVVWTLTQPRDLRRGILKPCWSIGRLMEITKICITDKDALTEIFELLRDCTFITRNLCQVFKEYSDVLDFSKLED